VKEYHSKTLTITFLTSLLTATTIFSTIFAVPDTFADKGNENGHDKIKLDCLDVALTLVTLDFAIDLGGEDLEYDLSSTLDEAEIAPDLESIEENFQNVLDKLENRCDEENVQDILEFIDFTD
jgi:hypothetical protein